MVSSNEESLLVYGHKLSSVGPGSVTGDLIHEPSNMDLAMKLHYLRIVYFLESQAVEGLSVTNLKEQTFSWLNYYYESCGRFRRSDTNGRPYLKCNDCGVRFVEAKSSKTLEEWLDLEDSSALTHSLLVYRHVLGPELTFSPPVFLQMTSFSCGGMSLGLSWSHVLGDAFSVSNYMNCLAQFLNGKGPTHPPKYNKSPSSIQKPINLATSGPLCLKQVGPLGDHWTVESPCEMDTFSFHVTATQLDQLHLMQEVGCHKIQPFEALSAVIWWSIAKVVTRPKLDTVTLIKHDCTITTPTLDDNKDMILSNTQVVSSVEAHFPVTEAQVQELVELIRVEAQDERAQIADLVSRDPGGSDFIIYGSNLTFVDLGESGFYEFGLNGMMPRLVNCYVDSIGEEGVVLVLPGPKNGKKGDEGRLVTLILPKDYMEKVKLQLKKEWSLII